MDLPKISSKQLHKMMTEIRPMRRFAVGEEGLFAHEKGFLHYLNCSGAFNPRTDSLFSREPSLKVRRKLRVILHINVIFVARKEEQGRFVPHLSDVFNYINSLEPSTQRKIVAFEIVETPGGTGRAFVPIHPQFTVTLDVRMMGMQKPIAHSVMVRFYESGVRPRKPAPMTPPEIPAPGASMRFRARRIFPRPMMH